MPKTKIPPEKRLARFRSKPTIAIQTRIDRALTQRLYLIQVQVQSATAVASTASSTTSSSVTLSVLGSTGNVYEVTLSKIPSCTCPDHMKGNLCKHLLFVMLKVAGLRSNDPLVYQSAYITEELETIIAQIQRRAAHLSGILANEAVRQKHQSNNNDDTEDQKESENKGVQRKPIEKGTECPICFDDVYEYVNDLRKLTYCQQTCGTNFHAECMKAWTGGHGRQHNKKKNPTCPACRQPWVDVATGGCCVDSNDTKKKNENEGYQNYATLQGQSRVRDTSTYQPRWDYGYRYKRRRY